MLADWPAPSPAAAAQSEALMSRVREQIEKAGGWLDFEQYMQLVLYSPGLGYYSAGAQKFGEDGDFVTAPGVSPVFGAGIARAIAPALAPGDSILELGAGSGALAAAILDALTANGAPPVQYRVLEVSAELRARQQRRLDGYPVQWLDTLPQEFRGVLLANEVADALAVRRFRWQPDGVQELGVVHQHGALAWSPRPADAVLADAVTALRDRCGHNWPVGYVSEACLQLAPWIKSLAATLARGVLLICDYGLPRHEYYHPQRSDGTLICHYRHRAHADPFLLPGLQDISAWVDFTTAAEAGVAAGLDLLAFTTQAQFLMASGVLDSVAAADPVAHARHAASLRRLLLPGEMGEHFKMLALGRGVAEDVLSVGRDFRHRL